MDGNNKGNCKITPLIGNSSFINEIKNLLSSLSSNCASVMILGEKGSGKRLYAQHLHYEVSGNLNGFYEVNCKTFLPQDFQNLLMCFKGFKTQDKRITLFLNHIKFLSLDLQILLLELLKTVNEKKLNIKVICASEISLEDSVQKNEFSADLFYKLNSIVLNFLPLRQRKDDILPIAVYYLNLFRCKSGQEFNSFSKEAESALENAFYKGNVDELVNSIQRAFIVGQEPIINPLDLGFNDKLNSSITACENLDCTLKDAIDSFKKEYLTKVLEANGWNQTKTAQILGIQRTYVIRLINELGIRK